MGCVPLSMVLVIALGGNAILRRGEKGTAQEQIAHVRDAAHVIAAIAGDGDPLLITHGNGPQVGDILMKNEFARDILPPMPLDICGAESQGMIGYMLQQSLENAFLETGSRRRVISLVTQTLVDANDPAFSDPTKPVGPYFSEEEADRLGQDRGWTVRRVSGGERGWRRVVPSPDPREVVEAPSIHTLVREGFVTVAAGGGGIPVIRTRDHTLQGVEAVVDKDLATERLATAVAADRLLILTNVPFISRSFGTPREEHIREISAGAVRRLLAAGEFGEGSMAPKVEACARFVEHGGSEAVVADLASATEAAAGRAGTRITPA
ncbi:MAG: carbamate kinase [Methanomicrobiales archaeon]